uniref:Pentatricopeptide repeat-containing protein n=1 Tax=Salix viminalis TaxID=40686 RepID=A0A6N2LYB3_SALVM
MHSRCYEGVQSNGNVKYKSRHSAAQLGRVDEALLLFFQMLKKDIKPDVITYCTLIDGLCKLNKTSAGLCIFDFMCKNAVAPDIAIYNVLINMLLGKAIWRLHLTLCPCVERGPKPDVDDAVQLFAKMTKKVEWIDAMLIFSKFGEVPNPFGDNSCLIHGYFKFKV